MRRSFFKVFIATVFSIMTGYSPLAGPSQVYAGSETLVDQVVRVLSEESSHEKIKVIVLDFRVIQDADRKPSEDEIKDLSSQYMDEFIADIMQKLSDAGKQSSVSIIDRSKLNEILRSRKPTEAVSAGQTATELGTLAGADVVMTGSVKISGDASTAMVKVVRVKDGEIIGIVKQEDYAKPLRSAFAPITVIDKEEKIEMGAWKALPVNLTYPGTLHVTVDVVRGNPVDVIVMDGEQREHFEKNERFTTVSAFTAGGAKHYQREAHIKRGDYYLVLRDSSVGIFSSRRSEIKVTVRLEP